MRDSNVLFVTNRRHLLLAVAAAMLAMLGVVVVSNSARATTREGFEIGPGQTVNMEYPQLVGVNPQDEVEPSADNCKTVTFCDNIPFVVHAPENLGEDDSFYVAMEITWDDPSKSNDVDVYAYDKGQLKGGTTTRMGKAATSSNPEKINLQQPTLGEYQLVVMNRSGVNTGYKLKARMVRAKFESPVEQLAPPKNPPPAATTDDTTKPEESVEPTATAGSDTTPATLAPVPVGADNDFDFGGSDFDDQLAAPEIPQNESAGATRRAAPKEVAGIVLVAWFVIVPLLALGGGAAVILRRRRNFLLAA